MSIQSSGGTYVNTTFTSDGTRRQLIDQLSTALAAAGWSYISGSGSADVLMKTAVTAQGASCRVRLYDPAANNCAQVTFKDNAGSSTSPIAYLLPTNGKQFRIVANKFQFFLFSTGAGAVQAPREIVMGGTIYLPAFMASYVASSLDIFWMQFTGSSDTDTATTHANFRSTLSSLYSSASLGAALFNGTLTTYTNGFYVPTLRQLTSIGSGGANINLWADNSYPIGDSVMLWANANNGTTGFARGLMWDAFVLFGGSLAGEATITGPDGNTYMVITHNLTSQLCVRVA